MAFYEIFNEILARMTPSLARQLDYATWDSRHPPSTPYFLEFVPLLEAEGGVRDFDEDMAFDRFFPKDPSDSLSASEKKYIDRLVGAAWAQEKIPVLACTRSLGRSRAIQKEVGPHTILLQRNLFHQWASYRGQADAGNVYFLDTILKTLRNAAHDPYLATVSMWYGLGDRTLEVDELFELFCILHLYLYSVAFDTADLVVDISKIASDPCERARVEGKLSAFVHHDVDLSDVREICDFADFSVPCRQKTRDTIEQFAKLIPAASMSPLAARNVEQAMTNALSEWDMYEFFNHRSRAVYGRKIEIAYGRIDEVTAAKAVLELECQRLMQQRSDETRIHADEVAARCTEATALAGEREVLVQRLAVVEAARHDLEEKASNLAAEREALRSEIAGLKAETNSVAIAAE